MGWDLRRCFDVVMTALALDPYGHGSTSIKEQDYRQAAVTDTVVYYVSADLLLVTVVRIVH
jgi:hypothetical protein